MIVEDRRLTLVPDQQCGASLTSANAAKHKCRNSRPRDLEQLEAARDVYILMGGGATRGHR
ncbi:hypothetical protein N7450_009515 [Penicillium hetheringtonii]|uniref:Uncharacterized protein n=1 Tax=Penicillium hetheringtonii TaxID=911720 RepID=A0AAD6DB64_9EURO|nr:hypothetical protein N7450_009515 [Penicillium hetheringtonii]